VRGHVIGSPQNPPNPAIYRGCKASTPVKPLLRNSWRGIDLIRDLVSLAVLARVGDFLEPSARLRVDIARSAKERSGQKFWRTYPMARSTLPLGVNDLPATQQKVIARRPANSSDQAKGRKKREHQNKPVSGLLAGLPAVLLAGLSNFFLLGGKILLCHANIS
jgi:hypothetical protein